METVLVGVTLFWFLGNALALKGLLEPDSDVVLFMLNFSYVHFSIR